MNTIHEPGNPETMNQIGAEASAVLVNIMEGVNPDIAFQTYFVGTDSMDPMQAENIAGLRGTIAEISINKIKSSLDAEGQDGLERFSSALGRMVGERLSENSAEANQRRDNYTTRLEAAIEESEDEEDKEYYRGQLLRAGSIVDEPIKFVTDYHGVTEERDTERFDNDLLYEAIIEASTTEGEVDYDVARALNNLLPSKMLFTIEGGDLRISLDGKELERPTS